MGTNCAPLLTDYFRHAYDADFLQWLLANKPGTLTTLGTHDTGRRQTKHKQSFVETHVEQTQQTCCWLTNQAYGWSRLIHFYY
jgi:hypothetical protein